VILRLPAGFAKIDLEENQQARSANMEIVGIGTDIVECLRIGRLIEQHGELFLSRVFTAREIRYCQERKRAIEHFAGRWAAKEAILKSLGTGWQKGISWTDVEVRNDFSGQPRVLLCGGAKDVTQSLKIKDIMISISHCRAYATAYALAIGCGEKNPPTT
jgi:holo-[acyl-carrier protein] synthase